MFYGDNEMSTPFTLDYLSISYVYDIVSDCIIIWGGGGRYLTPANREPLAAPNVEHMTNSGMITATLFPSTTSPHSYHEIIKL